MSTRLLILTLAAGLGLSACDRNDRDGPPPSTGDRFNAQVSAVVNEPEASAETREPVTVEAVMATSPENAEAMPL